MRSPGCVGQRRGQGRGQWGPSQAILLGTGRGSVKLLRKKYLHDSVGSDPPPTSPQPLQ